MQESYHYTKGSLVTNLFYWMYYYFIHLFDLDIKEIHVQILLLYLLVLNRDKVWLF